jgi:hypothetical protein
MRASTSCLAVGLCLALACKSEEPAPPPKQVDRGVDLAKIPVPEHTPEMLSDPGKPRKVASPGSLDVEIGGATQHFSFMPKGVNAAVWAEDTKVAWVRVTGQASPENGPWVRIQLSDLRLDEIDLPATFKTSDNGKVKLSVRYELDPVKWWEAKSGTPSDNVAEVTLEAFEGRRLRGTFKGTLDPKAPDFGKPLPLENGAFDVELRLNGVAEGKAPDGPS